MPGSRRDTLRRLAGAVADGSIVLDPGVDPDVARASLLARKGIGPWTADYVVMRGLSHPDVFLDSDLGVRHAIDRITLAPPDPRAWAPWRSYAVHHLWADLTASMTTPVPADPSFAEGDHPMNTSLNDASLNETVQPGPQRPSSTPRSGRSRSSPPIAACAP